MHKISFITFCIGFVLLFLFCFGLGSSSNLQIGLSILLISVVGIPHGAIDHVLFLEKSKIAAWKFYLFYFGLMGIYIIAWIKLTSLSLLFFLLLSAYHFGQSQFSDLHIRSKLGAVLLYLFWGISLQSSLIIYHYEEIHATMNVESSMPELAAFFTHPILLYINYFSLAGTAVSFIVLSVIGKLSAARFIYESIVLCLVLIAFAFFSPIVGFTLYFISLHSVKVMEEEFSFLQKVRLNFSILQFIKLLLPYSIIGFIGTWGLVAFMQSGYLAGSNSDILWVLILLSVLTLPHSIVMERFYLGRYKLD